MSILEAVLYGVLQGIAEFLPISSSGHLSLAHNFFGTEGVQYSQIDENHFTVTAKLEVGSMFYGWLLGFGKGAKFLTPDNEVEKFRDYIQGISEMY